MSKKWIKLVFLSVLTGMCVGCYRGNSNGDDDLITTPVTNNPNFLPEKDGSFGPPSGMPY